MGETPPAQPPYNSSAVDVRDDLFYIDTVVFKVENVLFRVPRHGLETEDSVFTAMFRSAHVGSEAEGSDDAHPIILPQVTAFAFRNLLKATYPQFSTQVIMMTNEDWKSVLLLSDMWTLGATKKKAIDVLDVLWNPASPIEKIMLGKRHRVSKWLVEGYEALGKRKERLTREERERLGDETSWNIVDLRECAWAWEREQPSRDQSPSFGPAQRKIRGYHGGPTYTHFETGERKEYDFRSKIREIFGAELCEDDNYQYLTPDLKILAYLPSVND